MNTRNTRAQPIFTDDAREKEPETLCAAALNEPQREGVKVVIYPADIS